MDRARWWRSLERWCLLWQHQHVLAARAVVYNYIKCGELCPWAFQFCILWHWPHPPVSRTQPRCCLALSFLSACPRSIFPSSFACFLCCFLCFKILSFQATSIFSLYIYILMSLSLSLSFITSYLLCIINHLHDVKG